MFKLEDLTIKNTVKLTRFDDVIGMKLKSYFIISDELLAELGIEKMELYYNDKPFPEVWTFCKYDGTNKPFTKLRRYIVSTYGGVISTSSKKLIAQHNSSMKSSTVTGERYQIVNLALTSEYNVTRAVHRLVGLAFLKKKKGKNVIDHIDENPSHNWVWNLEWTDKSGNSNKHNMFVERQRTGRAIDTTWKYTELVAICKMIADGHKATYIYNKMLKLTHNDPKIQYERIRVLYKHIMRRGDFHDIAVKCGVKFGTDTLKEKASVAKIQEEKANKENEKSK